MSGEGEEVRPVWPLGAIIRARADDVGDSFRHVAGGAGTAVLAAGAFFLLLAVALLSLAGVGLFLVPAGLSAIRTAADRERQRLSRWGPEIPAGLPPPDGVRAAIRDAGVHREIAWAAWHGTVGFFTGMLAISLPFAGVHDLSFPLWWRFVPAEAASSSLGFGMVHNWPGAVAVCLIGLVTLAVLPLLWPGAAWLQAQPGRRLLPPDERADLALRVAQLTATRAAALDAHTAELRRIERSLHDGTQNRVVAVNVLIGAAQRALSRDPEQAREILDRAQDAAEYALAELRGVVRSILPPVLTERTLPDALAGLAADCPVDCRIDADLSRRYAMSLEATVYYAVAEALTNIARHSGASHATIRLRQSSGPAEGQQGDRLWAEITDDGRGGADASGGSGLGGIRRRVEAHDGSFEISSPPGGPTVLRVSVPCGS